MNVNIVKYFDAMAYLSNVVHTSSTAGLLKNDGTVDTTSYATAASVSAITDGQSIDSFSDVETALASKAENSVVGTVENGTTALQPYAVGEHFIRNDKFCTAIAAIASGATLTLNTNYVEGTIAECVARMGTYSENEVEIGTWNGARLYRKVFHIQQLPNAVDTEYPTGLSNITVKHMEGMAQLSDAVYLLCHSSPDSTGNSIALGYSHLRNSIIIATKSDRRSMSADITLEYIKNS